MHMWLNGYVIYVRTNCIPSTAQHTACVSRVMMNTHRFHICRLAQLIYIALKVQTHICVTPIYGSTVHFHTTGMTESFYMRDRSGRPSFSQQWLLEQDSGSSLSKFGTFGFFCRNQREQRYLTLSLAMMAQFDCEEHYHENVQWNSEE